MFLRKIVRAPVMFSIAPRGRIDRRRRRRRRESVQTTAKAQETDEPIVGALKKNHNNRERRHDVTGWKETRSMLRVRVHVIRGARNVDCEWWCRRGENSELVVDDGPRVMWTGKFKCLPFYRGSLPLDDAQWHQRDADTPLQSPPRKISLLAMPSWARWSTLNFHDSQPRLPHWRTVRIHKSLSVLVSVLILLYNTSFSLIL